MEGDAGLRVIDFNFNRRSFWGHGRHAVSCRFERESERESERVSRSKDPVGMIRVCE